MVKIVGPTGHRLTVQRTEVTQGEFEKLVGHNPSYHRTCGSNCPVEQVTMTMATRYADKLSDRAGLRPCYSGQKDALRTCEGFRLPFQDEWEWIAFDAPHIETDAKAWTKENSGFETKSVCSIGTQRFGLCDLFGNVWEWTHGVSQEHNARSDVRVKKAVARGGSFAFKKKFLKAPSRWVENANESSMTIGFRLLTTSTLE